MKTLQKIPHLPAIEVHIGTLVVNGLAVSNASHLGAVVQNELRILLAENGLGHLARAPVSDRRLALAALHAPPIHLSRVAHASDAGEKIAHAIHGGLRM
jgi:hypothetical protein